MWQKNLPKPFFQTKSNHLNTKLKSLKVGKEFTVKIDLEKSDYTPADNMKQLGGMHIYYAYLLCNYLNIY